MSTYLLTCECGKTIPVEVGQAGGRVTCACGATLDVPTLRKLRHLPVERPAAGQSRAAWNPHKGFVAAGLIVAGLLVAAALWSRLAEPKVPELDTARQLSAIDTDLATVTPAQAWQRWVIIYRPLAATGFAVFEHPHKAIIEEQIAERRFLQKTLLVLAAATAVVAIAVSLLWPRPVARV